MKRITFILFVLAFFSFDCSNTNNESNENTATKNNTEVNNENIKNTETDESTKQVENELNETIRYETYCNSKFDYCVDYPVDILIPQEESPMGDGRIFLSDDETRKMTVWGEFNILDETLQQRMEDNMVEVDNAETEITDEFFVIKGMQNGKHYYQKTKMVDDRFVTIVIKYPAEKARSCEKVIQHITKSI